MSASTILESILIRETAEEYRTKGYEVSTGAPLEFFHGYIADIVARRNDETRVIEVKSRSTLAANPRIAELAGVLESKKGWTFELVLAGEPERRDSPEGARLIDRTEIEERIQEALTALDAGLNGGAFMLAWSACEAATRELVVREGVSAEGITSANYALDQARYLGVLSGDQYRQLMDFQKHRNAVVHGFSNDVSAEMVLNLIETTRQIIASDE